MTGESSDTVSFRGIIQHYVNKKEQLVINIGLLDQLNKFSLRGSVKLERHNISKRRNKSFNILLCKQHVRI